MPECREPLEAAEDLEEPQRERNLPNTDEERLRERWPEDRIVLPRPPGRPHLATASALQYPLGDPELSQHCTHAWSRRLDRPRTSI